MKRTRHNPEAGPFSGVSYRSGQRVNDLKEEAAQPPPWEELALSDNPVVSRIAKRMLTLR